MRVGVRVVVTFPTFYLSHVALTFSRKALVMISGLDHTNSHLSPYCKVMEACHCFHCCT